MAIIAVYMVYSFETTTFQQLKELVRIYVRN